MDLPQLAKIITEVIQTCHYRAVDVSTITEETKLSELGFSSVSLFCLVMDLEAETSQNLDEEGWHTVGDILSSLNRQS